ncbi:hypothetical protein [Cupriavidus sp. BIC8F]|uniref:hypothetical protein n=1 Tax=Cupriavidus sp. BIC8F TaxID=3079014 RepID=UPI003967DD4B
MHLLLTLPDQSRGLIPADWTDFPAASGSVPTATGAPTSDALGSIADLLHARLIIDALLRHTEQESNNATEPTLADLPSGDDSLWEQLDPTTREAVINGLARAIAKLVTYNNPLPRENNDD